MQDRELYRQILGIEAPWFVERGELKPDQGEAHIHLHQTVLHAQPPRTECEEHGVRVVRLPWADPSSRFTALFERLAMDWLRAASQRAVGEHLGLSWDEIHGITERAVERGLERRQADKVPALGVDEKAFRKGHQYFTLVNDLGRGRVLYVAEDRTQASLDGIWTTLTDEQVGSM